MARPAVTTPSDRQEVPGVDIDDAPYSSTIAPQDDSDLKKDVAELVKRLRRVKPVPFLLPVSKQTAAGPLTFNFLDMGGPPAPNRIWNVLRVAVWGIDPFTALAGNAFAFIDTKAPVDSATEPLFINLIDIPVSMPNVTTWSGHQVTLRFGEHFILGFKGVPASTNIFASIQGEEEDLFDFRVDRD